MMTAGEIASAEHLGRSVLSSRNLDRSLRGKAPHHVFLVRKGETEISLDRFDRASATVALVVAENVAANRNASFYGWAVIVADVAGANGRRTIATPQPGNPYHADIVLPGLAAEDREELKRHAQELADGSTWRERPSRLRP